MISGISVCRVELILEFTMISKINSPLPVWANYVPNIDKGKISALMLNMYFCPSNVIPPVEVRAFLGISIGKAVPSFNSTGGILHTWFILFVRV